MGEVIDFKAAKLRAELETWKLREVRAQSALFSSTPGSRIRVIAERELPAIQSAILAIQDQLVSSKATAARDPK